MTKTLLLSAAILALLTPGANASRVGNGGDGVRTPDGLMLLDLVEAGMELAPYFNPEVKADEALRAEVAAAIPFTSPAAAGLVAVKLREVELADKLAAHVLRRGIQMFAWSLVSPTLLDIPDEDTNLDIPAEKLAQLAVRAGKRIQINRDLWRELNAANQAALVFHEIVYAAIPPVDDVQDSPRARSLVGYLFSPRMRSGGRENFLVQAKGILPVIADQMESFKFSGRFVFLKSNWGIQYDGASRPPERKPRPGERRRPAFDWFGDWGLSRKGEIKLEFPVEENFRKYPEAVCQAFTYVVEKEVYTTQAVYQLGYSQRTLEATLKPFGGRFQLALRELSDAKHEAPVKGSFWNKAGCLKFYAAQIESSWRKAAAKDGFSYYP